MIVCAKVHECGRLKSCVCSNKVHKCGSLKSCDDACCFGFVVVASQVRRARHGEENKDGAKRG